MVGWIYLILFVDNYSFEEQHNKTRWTECRQQYLVSFKNYSQCYMTHKKIRSDNAIVKEKLQDIAPMFYL